MLVGERVGAPLPWLFHGVLWDVSVERSLHAAGKIMVSLMHHLIFIQDDLQTMISTFCLQKSFLPFRHSGAYLVSPHTPATSPTFCPKDGSTCRSPVRRSVSSAAMRCAPKAVPASPADPGKQRRAGKHCRWTKGASGVFGWKNSVEFFFSSSSSYIRKEKEREYGKGGRRWDLFEGMFVIAYEVGVVTM